MDLQCENKGNDQVKCNNSCRNRPFYFDRFMFQCLPVLGDADQELGPPPSVDEAANTLMTRLGFLLGEKVTEVQPGDQYNMEVEDENQVNCLSLILWNMG